MLWGREGNDSYFVDSDDIVVEYAGHGFDIVYARSEHVLHAGFEIEVLGTVDNTATTAINLTGNELANFVVGNAGANRLDGGAGGADVLWGREGNDSYFVDSNDIVVEYAGHGYDIVYARASHTLSAGFEIEVLGTVDNNASTAINLKGNEFANYVTGNAGANVVDGGAGSDYLQGRGGADSFAFSTALGSANVDADRRLRVGHRQDRARRCDLRRDRHAGQLQCQCVLRGLGRARYRRPDHLRSDDRTALLRRRRQRRRSRRCCSQVSTVCRPSPQRTSR